MRRLVLPVRRSRVDQPERSEVCGRGRRDEASPEGEEEVLHKPQGSGHGIDARKASRSRLDKKES